MQTPRLIPRRPRRCPFVLIGLLGVAALLMTLPSLKILTRSSASSGSSPSLPIREEEEDVDAVSPAEREFEKKAVSEDSTVNYLDPTLDDPLASFIVGYPLTPLSLEELRLCNPDSSIVLDGSYRCPQDQTCIKCIQPKRGERFRDLIGAFRNPEIEKKRLAQIASDFEGQHTIVMFTFNYAHSDLFLNWACSAHKLGIDIKAFTLVIPCDQKANALMKKFGFKTLDPAWQSLLSAPIKHHESYWGQDHADINNIALFTMVDLVNLGFHVFVHDADVAWTQDPLPFFKRAIRRRDFLGMLAPFWNSMGPVNTGLLYLAPTTQMKVFLKSMENAAIVKDTSDQRVWNTILRHFAFQQLEWRLLPQAIIYKYSGRHAKSPDDQTLLMHAVGSSKRIKLARYDLWLLTPECPFYSKELAALSEKERNDPELQKQYLNH